MGLDITAYSRLAPLEPGELPEDPDERWERGFIHTYAYRPFTASTRGLANHDVETVRGSVGGGVVIADGWLKETPDTRTHRFRAGSYSGYGIFRQMIAEIDGTWKNTQDDPEAPFHELVWFADNEGTIGPDAAADLLQDFLDHRDKWADKVRLLGHEEQYYLDKYEDWVTACRLAADGGVIDFH